MTEKLQGLIKKYRIYGWPALSAAIALLVTIFVIAPQLLGYFKIQKDITELERQTAVLNTKTASLNSISTSDFKNNLAVVLTVLPPDKDLPSSIGQVESLISSSGLQLQDLSFIGGSSGPSETDNSNVQFFRMKVEASGSKQSLQNFMQAVKGASQIMNISGLDISTNNKGDVLATVTLTAYYGAPQPALGSISSEVSDLTPQEKALLAKLQAQVASQSFSAQTGALPPRGKTNPFQ